MNIHHKTVALLCLFPLCLALTTLAQPASDKPNLVLILADDLGWGDVSYNQTAEDKAARDDLARTPNIDRISGEGLRFERFYVQPICTPTRSALMTGRYPWRYGLASGVILNHLKFGLPLDETLLPEVLKKSGYANFAVGKWHLGHITEEYLPTARGFDYHYGLYTAVDHFTHEWQGSLDWHRNGEPVREEGYVTNLLGDDAVRIIGEHDFSKAPLFLYHPMFAVHAWNQATEEDMAPYAHVKDKTRRGLLGLAAAMDRQVGRIVDALKERGQMENTLLMFISDNGGNTGQAAYNGALRGAKGQYYDGGVRVPAFAYWPGRIEPGRTTDALAYAADVFPTFAKLAGAPLPEKPLDGYDLSPVLFGKAESTGRDQILFILEDSERQRRGAMIDWPWKLYREARTPRAPMRSELYNLAEDPAETTDVAKEHPEIVEKLNTKMDEDLKTAPPDFWKPGDGQAPPDWKAPAVVGPQKG